MYSSKGVLLRVGNLLGCGVANQSSVYLLNNYIGLEVVFSLKLSCIYQVFEIYKGRNVFSENNEVRL